MSRLLGRAKFVGRQAAVVAPVALALAGSRSAFAQGTYPAPLPGERPTWMPEIPLSPTAVANGVVRSWEQRIEFVSVNVQNNPAFGGSGIPNGTGLPLGAGGDEGDQRFIGRGSVVQPFRIARFETSTQHWAEFVNAALIVQGETGSFGHAIRPRNASFSYFPSDGRWRASPTLEAAPAGGVDWRTAAMYCNWLHNDRAMTREAFMSGAYDVSTFAYFGGQQFSDQLTRSPGARFWIPSLDEMMAAMYYDPSRQSMTDSRGGWWLSNITRDTAPVYGRPPVAGPWGPASTGEANSGWDYSTLGALGVPLGSYPTIQSPWGLLDTAGGTSEWTEEVGYFGQTRLALGSAAAITPGGSDALFGGPAAWSPSGSTWEFGFRIATLIPSPTAVSALGFAVAWGSRRRR